MPGVLEYFMHLQATTKNEKLKTQINKWVEGITSRKSLYLCGSPLVPLQLTSAESKSLYVALENDETLREFDIAPRTNDRYSIVDDEFPILTSSLSKNKSITTVRLHTQPPIEKDSHQMRLLTEAVKNNFTITYLETRSGFSGAEDDKTMPFAPYIQRNYAIAQGMEQLRALMNGPKYEYAGMLLAYNHIDQALQASPEVVDETTRTRLIQIRQLLRAREFLQHNRADQALANLSTSYIDPELSSIAQKIKQETLKLQNSEEISAHLVSPNSKIPVVDPDSTTQYRNEIQKVRPSNLSQVHIKTIDMMTSRLDVEISSCKNKDQKALKITKKEALLALKTYAQTYSVAESIEKIENNPRYSNFKAGYFSRTKTFFNNLKQECQNSSTISTKNSLS